MARGEIDMAWSEVGGKWVKDAKRVDSRPTWSGWPLVAVPAARPAEVSGRRRRIDKICYVRFAPVPAIFERVTRSIPDLDGVIETVRERDPM